MNIRKSTISLQVMKWQEKINCVKILYECKRFMDIKNLRKFLILIVFLTNFLIFTSIIMNFKTEAPYKNIWIVKPSALSRGRGIYVTDDIHDIDQDESWIVSKYIHNPLLINSHKFDLRLYVLITSFEPLRIYIYKEGITRFASEPYSSGHKFNTFSHLTNYSINKKNVNFVYNQVSRNELYFRLLNRMITDLSGASLRSVSI